MVPRLAEQKIAMRQDNALMDLRRQGMEMDKQRFKLEQDQLAAQVEQQQTKLAELAQFRQAAEQLENTPEGHAQLQRRFPMLYKEAGLSSMLPEQPKLSADYQTYLSGMGMQNSPEAYRAWQDSVIAQKRAGATNVNVNTGSKLGPLPQGYMAVPDGRGGYHLARLPGHPDEAKELRRRESAARTGKTVIQDLERTLSIGGKAGVFGPTAIVTRNIPGSPTYTAEKMIQSALSNVGFDALQEMRQNSPTGGALGNVSDQEVTRLQQTLGSLDVTQPAPIVRDNIKRIINIYRDTVYGTPEQIRQLRDQGFIDPKRARELSQRYELSFDEFGKPIKKGAPRRGGARPQQGGKADPLGIR